MVARSCRYPPLHREWNELWVSLSVCEGLEQMSKEARYIKQYGKVIT